VPIVRDECFRKNSEYLLKHLLELNSNTCHLICNNFNLDFIWYCMLMCCVCVFSVCQESSDMILGDKPLISEVVLSHIGFVILPALNLT
jgi:hypothetical protein